MIKLSIVADGPRDFASLPPLVLKLLGVELEPACRQWKMIKARKGMPARNYGKKITIVLQDAVDAKHTGVIAVVDTDQEPPRSRFKELDEVRTNDARFVGRMPFAIGEATPHCDAWILDDEKAVREGLGYPPDHAIPCVTIVSSPKQVLNELIENSPALGEIARCIDPKRCTHAEQTGFKAFQEDLRGQLGHLRGKA